MSFYIVFYLSEIKCLGHNSTLNWYDFKSQPFLFICQCFRTFSSQCSILFRLKNSKWCKISNFGKFIRTAVAQLMRSLQMQMQLGQCLSCRLSLSHSCGFTLLWCFAYIFANVHCSMYKWTAVAFALEWGWVVLTNVLRMCVSSSDFFS